MWHIDPEEDSSKKRAAQRGPRDTLWERALAANARDDAPADPGGEWYDAATATWTIRAVCSYGYPRKPLGCLVIRLNDHGELVVSLA